VNKRGISVLEAILSFLILSILMTAIYALLAKGFYSIRFGSHKMDTFQTCLSFLNRINRELIMTNYFYISVDSSDPNSPVIAFPSPFDSGNKTHKDSLAGKLLWYKYILYYKSGDKVWRKIIPMGDAEGTSNAKLLEEFHFPDDDSLSGGAYNLPYYRTFNHTSIEGPFPAAYYVEELRFTKDDSWRSITVEIVVISPKNKEKGLKPSKEKLVIIPVNS